MITASVFRMVNNNQVEDLDEQPDPEDEKPKQKLEPKPGLKPIRLGSALRRHRTREGLLPL